MNELNQAGPGHVVPTPVITPEYVATLGQQELLDLWYASVQKLERAKEIVAEEQMLRRGVVSMFFPVTTEGTVDVPLSGGYVLKAATQFRREVDKAAYIAIHEELRAVGVPDTVIRWEPELDTKAYKALTGDALALMNTVVTTKPGFPAVSIVLPKRNRGA